MPRSPSITHLMHACRRWVAGCLLVALPLCGLSASLFQVLGPLHVHRGVAVAVAGLDAMGDWQDFRRGGGREIRPHPHPHSHGLFERHHHDPADATVLALDDGGASEVDGVSLAFLSLAFASADGIAWRLPVPAGATWPEAGKPDFESHTGALPERPPRA